MTRNRAWGLMAIVALGACSPDAGGQKQRTVESNGGTYLVSFASTPDPVPMNSLFDLKFSVAPKAGGKTDDLQVQVDARMPAHFHGMSRTPKLTRQADGSFLAQGLLFHMPGHWELTFDISRGGKTERAQVDIELK